MKFEEFVKCTEEELLGIVQPTKCASCGLKLHESKTGMRKLGDGTCVCSACFFSKIGEAIDDEPIGVPRMHR
jgi:hypothetical protein